MTSQRPKPAPVGLGRHEAVVHSALQVQKQLEASQRTAASLAELAAGRARELHRVETALRSVLGPGRESAGELAKMAARLVQELRQPIPARAPWTPPASVRAERGSGG